MKFIISGKVYDTEKSTLICTFTEKGESPWEIGYRNEIYVTAKKHLFLVKYNQTGISYVKKLDTKESGTLLDCHAADINIEAYTSIFETEEA